MTFYERFCDLCYKNGVKPHSRTTAENIGISNALVTAWKNGSRPRSDTLEKLSNYFGVSVEYLLFGGESRKAQFDPDDDLSEAELDEFLQMMATREECRMLFHLSKSASKQDVELAVKVIEELRKRG